MNIPKPAAPRPAAPRPAAPTSPKIQAPRPVSAATSAGLQAMLRIQQTASSGSSILKQNPSGPIRFRLLRPIVTPEMADKNPLYESPLAIRAQHWYSKINADGKEGFGNILCYGSVGRPCPICTLYDILLKYTPDFPDFAVYTDRNNKGSLGLARSWAAWVLDRGFMIGANAEYRPELDRIKELSVPLGVGEQMCNLMDPDRGGHGDASDPEYGYDFVVQGNNAAQKIMTKYTTLDKRGESYPYNPSIMQGKQPIYAKLESQLLAPNKLVEQLQLILAGMAAFPGYEHVIAEFTPVWDDLCNGGDGFGVLDMEYAEESSDYVGVEEGEEEYTPEIVSQDDQVGSLRGDTNFAQAEEEQESVSVEDPTVAQEVQEVQEAEEQEGEGEAEAEMAEAEEEVSAPAPVAPTAPRTQMKGPAVRPPVQRPATPPAKATVPGVSDKAQTTADRLASINKLKNLGKK